MRNVKFCPTCGSTNIDWELPQTWSQWSCRECGYIGAFIIEDGEMAVQIRKNYLEEKKKNESSD